MRQHFEQAQIAEKAPIGIHQRRHRLMRVRHDRDSVAHQHVGRDASYLDHEVPRCQTWTPCCAQNGPRIHVIDGGPQSLRENEAHQISVERLLTNVSKKAIVAVYHENCTCSWVTRKCFNGQIQLILGMIHRWCEVHQASKLAHRTRPRVTRLAPRRGSR